MNFRTENIITEIKIDFQQILYREKNELKLGQNKICRLKHRKQKNRK